MQKWANNIWIYNASLKFMGATMTTRMTIIKLSNGELFVHSPVSINDEIRGEVDALGPVAHIVSPNKFHHLYIGEWAGTYPDAKVYASPGLKKKRKDIEFDAELGNTPEAAWKGDLEQVVLANNRFSEEVVFYHGASRTLLVSDMCFNITPASTLMLRVMGRLEGIYNKPRMSPVFRWSYRDKDKRREVFGKVFEWDFDRVIMAHGELIESGGKELLKENFAWALK